MKVSELTGAELDWYVAKAEGIENVELRTAQRATNRICVVKASGGRQFDYTYSPSTQWNAGGPLIEKYEICIEPNAHQVEDYHDRGWRALAYYHGGESYYVEGETALISAMRCLVGTVFGDEVEDI